MICNADISKSSIYWTVYSLSHIYGYTGKLINIFYIPFFLRIYLFHQVWPWYVCSKFYGSYDLFPVIMTYLQFFTVFIYSFYYCAGKPSLFVYSHSYPWLYALTYLLIFRQSLFPNYFISPSMAMVCMLKFLM